MTAFLQQRLRLLHVILTRGFAGSERAAAETCNGLARHHDVALVVRRDHRSEAGASILDYVDSSVTVFEVAPRWRTRAAVGVVIEAWAPDVVHTHLRRGTRYIAQLNRAMPHVATVHIDLNGPHFLVTDALCCVAPWQVRAVRARRYGGETRLVPNTLVPQPRITPEHRAQLRRLAGAGPDDFVVGGMGRLTRGKGFDVLIDAFRAAELDHARLVIVGDGHDRAKLERRAAGMRVAFTGFRNDAKDWFQAFDLFVSPSRREPFGRVIVEALDAGTPVIASDALGPRDIAATHPVQLVQAGDVRGLALALRDAEARPREPVTTDLREFDVERVTDSLLDVYRSVLGRSFPESSSARAAAYVRGTAVRVPPREFG
jgi:glycosyltransferase involved in cell wall biosynthesis